MMWKRSGMVALLCVAAMLPPASRKRHRPITETSQGAGAKALLAKARKPYVVTNNYNRLLAWDWRESYGNYWSNTVFIVRSSPSLSRPVSAWSVAAWTPTNHWLFYVNADNPSVFFHVIVSNSVTRMVSE